MPISEQYNQLIDDLYQEGAIEEETYEELARLKDGTSAEKLGIGRAKTVLTVTDMLEDVYEQIEGPTLQNEVEQLTQWAEQYRFIDWESKTVKEDQIDAYLEGQDTHQELLETGHNTLEELDQKLDEAISVWNEIYPQFEYGTEIPEDEGTGPIEPFGDEGEDEDPTQNPFGDDDDDDEPDWMPDTDDDSTDEPFGDDDEPGWTPTGDDEDDTTPDSTDDDSFPDEPEDSDEDESDYEPGLMDRVGMAFVKAGDIFNYGGER